MKRRVLIGRTVVVKLRLCPCLASARKNRVQPSSGCRQGGDFTLKLATALWLSLIPATHPRSVTTPKRVVAGHTAAWRLCLCPCLAPASKNQAQPSSGCRQGGDFTSDLATAFCLSLLPVTSPWPRYSTKMSRRWPCGSASALSLSEPRIFKQQSDSKQLRVPTGGGDFTSNLAHK
jgi:hypothetical protein